MRLNTFRVVAGIVGIAIFAFIAFAGLIWSGFIGSESGRNEAALKRLRDRGYLPSAAQNVFVNDSHGGFHGDGTTFIVFDCTDSCLNDLRAKISQDHDYRLSRNPDEVWKRTLKDGAAKRTLEITTQDVKQIESLVPDLNSENVEFRCIGRVTTPFSFCTSLYLVDIKAGRFWYMNITT
ncbi:MAG: hypothetical protein ABFS45_15695 [Pseudomonadota bacterium]